MATIPIPPNIAKLTGPIVLGHFFNWGLFGVLVVQTYIYFLSFPKDTKLTKSVVYSVFIIELLQTVLTTRDAFRNFGSMWGNMQDLDEIGWLWFSVPVLGAIISLIAQVFFAWRIWILNGRNYVLPGIVTVLSLVQCIAAIWVGTWSHKIGEFSKMAAHTYRGSCIWLGGTALCDIIIAMAMIYYLTQSRTGFKSTNVLITKVIRVTVETGLICAAFAIIDLSFFLGYRDNNYHLAPSIALSKLYSNSLLVVLNSRVRVIGGRMNVETDSGVITPGNVFGTGPSIAFGKVSNKAPSSGNSTSLGGFGSESGDFTVNGIQTQKEYLKASYPGYPPTGMA